MPHRTVRVREARSSLVGQQTGLRDGSAFRFLRAFLLRIDTASGPRRPFCPARRVRSSARELRHPFRPDQSGRGCPHSGHVRWRSPARPSRPRRHVILQTWGGVSAPPGRSRNRRSRPPRAVRSMAGRYPRLASLEGRNRRRVAKEGWSKRIRPVCDRRADHRRRPASPASNQPVRHDRRGQPPHLAAGRGGVRTSSWVDGGHRSGEASGSPSPLGGGTLPRPYRRLD